MLSAAGWAGPAHQLESGPSWPQAGCLCMLVVALKLWDSARLDGSRIAPKHAAMLHRVWCHARLLGFGIEQVWAVRRAHDELSRGGGCQGATCVQGNMMQRVRALAKLEAPHQGSQALAHQI